MQYCTFPGTEYWFKHRVNSAAFAAMAAAPPAFLGEDIVVVVGWMGGWVDGRSAAKHVCLEAEAVVVAARRVRGGRSCIFKEKVRVRGKEGKREGERIREERDKRDKSALF